MIVLGLRAIFNNFCARFLKNLKRTAIVYTYCIIDRLFRAWALHNLGKKEEKKVYVDLPTKFLVKTQELYIFMGRPRVMSCNRTVDVARLGKNNHFMS